jgi:hypothetical protein
MVAKVKSLVRWWPDITITRTHMSQPCMHTRDRVEKRGNNRGLLTAHVRSAHPTALDNVLYRVCDLVRVVVEAEVPKHHAGREDHGRRVRDILALHENSHTEVISKGCSFFFWRTYKR